MHREGPRVGPRKAPESSPLQGARLHWQRGAPRGARPWPLAGAAASCNSPAGVVQWACGEAGVVDEAGEARASGGRMHEARLVHRVTPYGRMTLQPSRLRPAQREERGMHIMMKCAGFNPCFYGGSVLVHVSSPRGEFPQFVMHVPVAGDTVYTAVDEAIADAKGVPPKALDDAQKFVKSLRLQAPAWIRHTGPMEAVYLS